jgi:hypothetical protein
MNKTGSMEGVRTIRRLELDHQLEICGVRTRRSPVCHLAKILLAGIIVE